MPESTLLPRTAYSVREADLDADAAAIAALWAANLGGYDAQSAGAKLALGYRDNPAGGASVQLLGVEGEPAPQGAQGLHARRFWLGERAFRATGFGDFVVNAAHRSLWPALVLMQHCVQLAAARFDLTYGFPNAKAEPVCVRAGLARFGDIRRYAAPLSSRTFLARHMPTWIAHAAASLVDIALRLREGYRHRRAPERLFCRPVEWNHPAIDELWSRRPATLLLSERSGELLRWRFAAPGRGAWRLCLGTDGRGIPQGFVVWRDRGGLAEIGDFVATDPARWTAPLLRAFIDVARDAAQRSVSVEFFGAEEVVEQIQQAGLGLRPERRSIFTSKGLPPGLAEPTAWYITTFDDDADSGLRPDRSRSRQ